MAADERDVVRLRTNYRGEEVYLYATSLTSIPTLRAATGEFANGHLDQLLYERGTVDTRLPFERLRSVSRINERAKKLVQDPDITFCT